MKVLHVLTPPASSSCRLNSGTGLLNVSFSNLNDNKNNSIEDFVGVILDTEKDQEK